MLIDSHAHVNFAEYKNEIDNIIKNAHENNIWLINIGSNYLTSQKCIEIADKYNKGVYAAIGCHPIHLIKDIEESSHYDGQDHKFITKKEIVDFVAYKKLAQSSMKVVGIGEVGLDYYYFQEDENVTENKKIQKETLIGFISLAQELNLPLILHCRGSKDNPYDAYDDLLAVLTEQKYHKGVIHCFGGNQGQAEQFLKLGYYIGFTGIVTFKNAKELQSIAQNTPLDKILVETDAPFLAPEPHRGKRNEPLYVQYVAKKIAALKEINQEEVARITFANTLSLFNIKYD